MRFLICGRIKFVSSEEHNCALCEALQVNWEYVIVFLIKARLLPSNL